jgi:polysaccharide biosynthesis transport protein
MSLAQCLAILRARWKGALVVFLIVVSTAIGVSLMLPKQYSATASVVVNFKPDPVSALMVAGMASPGFMGTQVDLLQSDRVLRSVVRSLRLAENADVRQQWLEETAGRGSIETWLIEPIRKQMEVRPSRESGVIHVSYRAADPNFAAVVANAIVGAYLETSVALNVGPAKLSSAFFDSRAKEARAALESAQARLSTFQRERGIIATDERLDVENARLNDLSSQAVMLQALASEAASRQTQASGASGDKLQEVLANPVVGALRAELSRSEVRLQEHRARLGDSHPQVLESTASIKELRARIDAETQRVTAGVGVSDSIARRRDADVRAALEAQRNKVLRMKAVRDEGAVLLRDVESAQRALELLTGRLNQTTLESQSTQTSINPLNDAEPPIKPSSPKILVNAAVAVMLGAALALAGALLLELTHRRVRSAEDVSAGLALPLIGLIAPAQRGRRRGKERPSLAQQRMIGLRRDAGLRSHPSEPLSMPLPAGAPTQVNADPLHGSSGPRDDAAVVDSVLDRSIGDLLAEACRLQPEQVQRIADHQRASGMRFGEAAIELGLASTDDVLHALARQYHYPFATHDRHALSPELVALNQPFSAQAESFRALRSQVMKRVFRSRDAPRRALAVVSPNAGDGKSYVAANLAVALAQLGGRTLLIDADLRGPRQHEVFNMDNSVGLAGILSGRIEGPVVQQVPGVPGLLLLPVGNPPPNPLELVERPAFALLLNELIGKFDHVIVDTPAAQYGVDAAVIAEACGASLMLARKDVSSLAALEDLAIELGDSPSTLVGVVINVYRTNGQRASDGGRTPPRRPALSRAG